MTQKPLTINEVVYSYYFEEKVQAIIDSEAQAMKRLKYKPNYIVTCDPPVGHMGSIPNNFSDITDRVTPGAYRATWVVTRATLVYRAGKRRMGKSSKTVLYEETYERASKIEDCLNSIAFAYFQRGEEYKP